MAHAAERGWVWCWRWQSAVRVVVCQCRRIEVVQFLHVRPVNSVKNLSKCSLGLQDVGWVEVSVNWCLISLTRGGGSWYYVEAAGSLSFLSVSFLYALLVLRSRSFLTLMSTDRFCVLIFFVLVMSFNTRPRPCIYNYCEEEHYF